VRAFPGINVGKAKRVAMADLRKVVAGLGFSDVRTLLNSGNVVFGAPAGKPEAIAGRIEKAVAARLGVESRVTALGEEVATAVRENPLAGVADQPSRLLIVVRLPGRPRRWPSESGWRTSGARTGSSRAACGLPWTGLSVLREPHATWGR
jgi:uncharacterized protein (DUF1697 family)